MNDKPQESVGDDPWGTPQGTGSAFSDPNVIEAENFVPHEEGVHGDEHFGEDSAAPAARSKPNIAILALAGLLIIGVIGGAGFVAKQKFFPDRQPRERVAVIAPQDLAPETSPNGNVFDTPAAALPAASAPANVFDGPSATTLPAAAGAAPVTVTVSRPENPFPVDAIASTQPATSSAPAKAPSGVTVTVNVPPTELSADRKAAALVAAAPEVKPAQTVAAPEKTMQIERPASEKRTTAKAKTSKETPRQAARKPAARVASSSASRAKSTKRQQTRVATRSKAAAVARSEPSETFILPKGMKVQSIFPLSGANVQAWVTDGSGRTEVVRTGDTLRSGAQVIQIVAEKGQVITTSGVITTRGIN